MNQGLLWQITSPHQVISYIFGTMHIKDLGVIPRVGRVMSCLQTVERYYSEIQMDANPGEMIRFQQLPAGMDVSHLMSEHHYTRLRKSILRSFGIDIHRFRTLYPLILSNMIQMSILGGTGEEVMDYYLFGIARATGRELHYLESQSHQIELFHRIPLEYQIKSLRQLGRQPSKAKKQLLALVSDYKNGHTRQLYQKSRSQLGKIRHMLLYERNRDMAQTIAADLDTVSGFVSVGAAHLFGYQGILRLLKKLGYKIQPL